MFENILIISQLEYDKYQHIKVDNLKQKKILEKGKALAMQYKLFFEDSRGIEIYLENIDKNG